MKKAFLVLIVLLTVFCAFAQSVAETAPAVGSHTIVDHAGYEIEVPDRIDRVAVYGIFPLPSAISVFFNSADRIVAMPQASMAAARSGLLGKLYPEILDVETACVTGSLNIEELVKLDPQIVFINANEKGTREALTQAGLTAVGVGVNQWGFNALETLDNWVALLSSIFSANEDIVEKVRDYSHATLETVRGRVAGIPEAERARVFVLFQYSDSLMMTSGSSFFGQWWCDSVGAVNVAEGLPKDYGQRCTMEDVYGWNPDVIVITNFTTAQPETLIANAVGADDWSAVKAVRDGRVYKAPLGIYRTYTPGADAPVALLWWAKAIYPELFYDIDLIDEARRYYSVVFGIELTEGQLSGMFAPPSEAAGGV